MEKRPKIIHILHDEKFIDVAIDVYNSTSADNTYVSIEDNLPFKLIKAHAKDVLVMERDKILDFIVNGGFQLVVFHSLTRDKYELVLQIPADIKVLWSAWGYDIYEPWLDMPPVYPIELYKPLTQELFKSSLVKRLMRKIRNVLFYKKHKEELIELRRKVQSEIDLQSRLIKRIDYMSTILPYEYELLSKFKGFHAKYVPFHYSGKSGKSINQEEYISENADMILLGNSATATNNHLDVLNVLKEREIQNQCILPCSYGKDDYLEKLKNSVSHKPNIRLLDTYMPLDEYTNIMKSCRIGIFGHMRQQAVGNVRICIMQGCKIFFWRDSILYQYFKNAGYIVYTIEDDLTVENINTLMSDQERENNVRKYLEQFAFTKVIDSLESFYMNEL